MSERGCSVADELRDLSEYVAWMRSQGVRRMRSGTSGVEIELGSAPPEPPPIPVVLTESEAAEAYKKLKEQQERLLFASSEGLPDDFSDE